MKQHGCANPHAIALDGRNDRRFARDHRAEEAPHGDLALAHIGVDEIRELAETGLLDGVTTNPSLIHKSGRNFLEVVAEIAQVVEGPVSAEVVALDYDGMMRETAVLRKIADNVTIKVPLTPAGLKTC